MTRMCSGGPKSYSLSFTSVSALTVGERDPALAMPTPCEEAN